jgi:hypothetical protein
MALNTSMKEQIWAESMGTMPIGKTAALDCKSKPSGQSQPSSQSSQVTRKLTTKEETTLWWH